jgi:hypothetical protein
MTDMDALEPWPLCLPALPDTEGDDDGLAILAWHNTAIWLHGDAWWRDVEVERFRLGGAQVCQPTMSNLKWFVAETVDRKGVDYARSFVAAVLREDFSDPFHAALMANVGLRMGSRGLLLFAGFLAAHCTADELYRQRSA